MTEFVYFARCEGFVKIGLSCAPQIRVKTLRASSPFDVQLIGMHAGDRSDERALHARFLKDHIHSEWFRLTAEIEHVARRGFDFASGALHVLS